MNRRSQNIIQIMKKLINSDSFQASHTKVKKSFIRKRVLSFTDLIIIQINRLVLTTSVELVKFLERINSAKDYSKQAFSKARLKLKHTAFTELNEAFVDEYYREPKDLKLYRNNYLLFAGDGSMLQLYESEELVKHFGRWKNQHGGGLPMARASLMYDVLNQVCIDSDLQSLATSEKSMMLKHLRVIREKGLFHRFEIINLFDRGYAGLELMHDLITHKELFVIRCKEGYRNEIREFIASGARDRYVTLTNRVDGNNVTIRVRVLKIKLSTGEYEYLLTNTIFRYSAYKDLYFMRWGIETHYGFLKGSMQLENFSSKKVEGVLQDFHVCVLTANLANLLRSEAQAELDEEEIYSKAKNKKKINKNVAMGILRGNISKILLTDINQLNTAKLNELSNRIKNKTCDAIPNRSFERRKLKRNRRKNHLTRKKCM